MNPRLLEAAREGDVNKLQILLDEDEYIIERSSLNESAETILHVAVLGGKTEFTKRVLEKKPNLATRLNQDGFSAIHIASANGFEEIVRYLLKLSPELGTIKSSDGRSALHFAATNGNIGVIKELLELCPSCKDDVTFRGETALHLAVKNSQFEAFKVMVGMLQHLNLKELLNVGDKDGNTVLHYATAGGQIPILKFLLEGQDIEKGSINVNDVNESGLTALDVLDFAQQMGSDPTHYYMLRELLQSAAASKAKQLQSRGTDSYVTIEEADSFRQESGSGRSNWCQFFLKEISVLNPIRFYRKLSQEVKKSSAETQNALLVVAVLIATVTYEAIMQPPGGYISTGSGKHAKKYAYIAENTEAFILFMVPNSIGFFASVAVISLLIHKFPLSSLLGLAVRCLAASFIGGFLLIGPNSFAVSDHGLLIIGTVVLLDFGCFIHHFCRRFYKETEKRRMNP